MMFYDMGMIEKYGSGMGRIIDACKAAHLPEPDFANFSGGFRILFKPKAVGPESRLESRLAARGRGRGRGRGQPVICREGGQPGKGVSP